MAEYCQTSSRQRELHPHLHIMVPNGGFDSKRKQWRKGKKDYLFNEFALANVWRARVFEAITKHPDLSLINIKQMPKKWVVDCRKVGHGLPALKYLSRYLYRGVIPDKDIIHYDQHNVTFRYKDSTKKNNHPYLTRTQVLNADIATCFTQRLTTGT